MGILGNFFKKNQDNGVAVSMPVTLCQYVSETARAVASRHVADIHGESGIHSAELSNAPNVASLIRRAGGEMSRQSSLEHVQQRGIQPVSEEVGILAACNMVREKFALPVLEVAVHPGDAARVEARILSDRTAQRQRDFALGL